MGQQVRRVVTGHDGKGRSLVVEDTTQEMAGRLHELWITRAFPAPTGGAPDLGPIPKNLEPPKNGTLLRFVRFEPQESVSRAELERRVSERFAAMNASHCRVDTSRHPSMHKTHSLDYGIVLSGKIHLLMDEGEERELGPFSVVIQRGTNHGWVNRGTEPAFMAFVLMDGADA